MDHPSLEYFVEIARQLNISKAAASLHISQQSLSAGERELADANAERSALLDEVEALSAQLEFAQTDEYVVRVARDELGMLMPGEIRYVSAD